MLSSYFKIALRYLGKRKLYSFINIAGLSLGLSCAMLILLYTKDELSFDAFHENVNSIYEVTVDVRFPDGSSMAKMGVSSILLGPHLQANLPEVESYARLAKAYWDIKIGGEVQSQSILLADTTFFSMLTFPLLHGNPKTALQLSNSVVISEDMAIRHFGTEDALDKTLLFERGGEFKPFIVTGVAKRCPQNSSIQFEAILPLIIPLEEQTIDRWANVEVNTLLRISKGSDMNAVAAKMQQLYEEVSKEAFVPVRAMGFTQEFYHQLQPLTDIHLSQEFKAENSLGNESNPLYSYILSGIALFILAIASINFVNLTIAQSVKRAREIGIRKVVGSGRRQLIGQFLGESFFLCAISFIGAMLLTQLLLPMFNEMTNKALELSYLIDAQLLTGYVVLFLATGLLAGFYPAIILSGYSPVQTLYNQFRLTGKAYLQKGLVVFQFTLATVMIMGTLTVYLQFGYLTNKDLGYDDDHLVTVLKRKLSPRESKYFSEELIKNPSIELVAPQGHQTMNAKINDDVIQNFTYEVVDENFIKILNLKLTQGRNFSAQFPSDSVNSILVNEAFVKMAGWKNPVGEQVDFFLTGEKKTVIGIVKNYHYASLRETISPQCFAAKPDAFSFYNRLLIRIDPNSESTSLPLIERTFKKIFPMQPYAYQFVDEVNKKNYEAESKWKKVILFGAVLTIFISAIGLFGLSVLTAEKRFKEIGIRKVLGASTKSITVALTKDFLMLIFVSLLVAMPITYYAGTSWLQTYPYRTTIGPSIFLGTGILVLIIALCTISYQSIKAALMNPVESLKRD